jgi:hypothetical protein
MKKLVRRENSSLVVGSPKLTFQVVPCPQKRKPDQLMSTGSISYPKYYEDESDKYKITNQVAEDEHFYSAIIIELDGENRFYPRPVSIEKSTGKCRDMGIAFMPDGRVSVENPLNQVYGDLHSYQKDVVAFNAALKLAETLQIPEGTGHDVYDGATSNTHNNGRHAENTAKTIAGQKNMGQEIDVLVKDLNSMTAVHKVLHIISSNHDDQVARQTENGEILFKDYANTIYGAAVFPYLVAYHLIHTCHVKNPAKAMADYMHMAESELLRRYPKIDKGISPLEALVDMNAPKNRNQIKFVDIDGSLMVGRTDLSFHGDRGSSGKPWSEGAARVALGSYVRGHSHSPYIYNDCYTVGHLSEPVHSYNRGGFGGWLNSVAHVYADGSKQMIFIIDGKYSNMDIAKLRARVGKGIKV